MTEAVSALFSPGRLGPVEFRNGVIMSPMSQNSAGEDGCATDWHLVHYGSRAVGGCGLVLFEDTAVLENGRVSAASLGLYDDAHVAPLARVVDFCKAAGAVCGIQIAHAGRKAFKERRGADCDLVSSVDLAFGEGWLAPRATVADDMPGIVQGFADGARRARAAGFGLVEIHAAHGYLLHQFLSPALNDRTDDWGGTAAGREKLLFDVLQAVLTVAGGDMAVIVRLPAQDGLPGGLTSEDIADLSRRLVAAGAHGVDVAAGNIVPGLPPVAPEIQHDLARSLLAEGVPAICGGARDAAHAETLVAGATASMVVVGRPILRQPYWPLQAAQDLGVQPPVPSQYALAF